MSPEFLINLVNNVNHMYVINSAFSKSQIAPSNEESPSKTEKKKTKNSKKKNKKSKEAKSPMNTKKLKKRRLIKSLII